MKTSQYKMKHYFKSKVEDDDSDEESSEQNLGYFVKSHTMYHYTVPIDTTFREPSYYRGVIQMLMNAGENDTVAFLINSPGGSLAGLLSLMEAINMTEAGTVSLITGNASSAASMFALCCDEIYVSDNATMLAHNITYGTAGKGADVLAHVQHTSKTANKLLRKTYKYFLTDSEIDDMIEGKEIYLESDEIVERLKLREEFRLKEQELLEKAAEEPTEAKPVRKSRKKPEVEPEIIV
jgi:ATP-dependent protease ClpP protease subunit